MTLLIIRIIFILLSGLAGFQLSRSLVGTSIGAGLALGLVGVEVFLRKFSLRGLTSAVLGLLFGVILSRLVLSLLDAMPLGQAIHPSIHVAVVMLSCYLGVVIALRGQDDLHLIIPYVRFSRQDRREEIVILDTSVIIDGRISDICKTRFIEGKFVIPRFVLKELQQIADSQDPIKRNRGRRGLDVLALIQKIQHIDVSIRDEDFLEIKEVDAKLVKLAQVLGGKILTNDFNLNKIAELQGVRVLNINELANALKPVVLPGELMETRVIKEGKEYNQGVAYLDDGTMVVVEQGRSFIGQQVRVLVTSVLQTAAGRMIFARPESGGSSKTVWKNAK